MHFCVARGPALRLDENEAIEFAGFAEAVGAVERSHDFVVVDTAAPTIISRGLPIRWQTR
jgi:chromosome partitioning protein